MPGSLLSRLPTEWRAFGDATAGTVVLLHPSGLWVEVDAASVLREHDADSIRVLVSAFATGVVQGWTGRHRVESTAADGACTSARLVRW